jgi:hypothetical protein
LKGNYFLCAFNQTSAIKTNLYGKNGLRPVHNVHLQSDPQRTHRTGFITLAISITDLNNEPFFKMSMIRVSKSLRRSSNVRKSPMGIHSVCLFYPVNCLFLIRLLCTQQICARIPGSHSLQSYALRGRGGGRQTQGEDTAPVLNGGSEQPSCDERF